MSDFIREGVWGIVMTGIEYKDHFLEEVLSEQLSCEVGDDT